MPSYTTIRKRSSELLTALGALSVAQEKERPASEVGPLTSNALHALSDYRKSRGELAA